MVCATIIWQILIMLIIPVQKTCVRVLILTFLYVFDSKKVPIKSTKPKQFDSTKIYWNFQQSLELQAFIERGPALGGVP